MEGPVIQCEIALHEKKESRYVQNGEQTVDNSTIKLRRNLQSN